MRTIDCPGERRVRENRMHGVGGGGRKRPDDAQPHVARWVAYRWRASRLPRYRGLGPELNERQRRLWAASEARACGRGGIAAVVRATGIGRNTVVRGIAELREGARIDPGRVRRAGAGRPRLTEADPELLAALEALVDPDTRGDPCSPLRWSSRAWRSSLARWSRLGIRFLIGARGSCCGGWGFGCTRIRRRGRARIIPTVTRSFGISTRPPGQRLRQARR